MKYRVSDYIAEFFAAQGLDRVFTVVGGGAMFLNDSFGHHKKLKCLYNHHEQASAMAADGYTRIAGKPAILCVTSGPGAVNALNGVIGAYQDSIPMIVVSGQVKSTMTVRSSGLKLRTLGGQEMDVVAAVGDMTKYVVQIQPGDDIPEILQKAYHKAVSGRPGPVWLDVPIDVQGAFIEAEPPNKLVIYGGVGEDLVIPEEMESADTGADIVADLLTSALRPVIYAGNGIRLSGAADSLRNMAANTGIPIVTCWNSIDLIPTEDVCYAGRAGLMGDRAGNFAVQNSDLVIAIGARLCVYQTGYCVESWARAAKVAVVDIDREELKKPTFRVDIPIVSDAGAFIKSLNEALSDKESLKSRLSGWREQCHKWQKRYPVVSAGQKTAKGKVNVYAFMDVLSRMLKDDGITVVANGSASVVGSHSYYIKENSRFVMNCAFSSMGYGLPAAIGAALAADGEVIAIEGDGSLMMNIQELQTVATGKVPVKLFIINNCGYHQIRQTQANFFEGKLVGVGPDSGDLGFPNFKKIAAAFALNYFAIDDNQTIGDMIEKVLAFDGPCITEVFVTVDQKFEPKSSAKKLPDGRIVSPPLEDMAPFLSKEELEENMLIPLWGDNT